MIVGTSCQLRALEKIAKNKCNELINICIFCKQQKTLDSTRFLAKIIGEKINKDKKFYAQYRGTGWPGIVKINNSSLPWHRAAQLPLVGGYGLCLAVMYAVTLMVLRAMQT